MPNFFYIKANPKRMNKQEYNNFVGQYRLPNSFVIDFVHDVTDPIVVEVNPGEFNIILKDERYYCKQQ